MIAPQHNAAMAKHTWIYGRSMILKAEVLRSHYCAAASFPKRRETVTRAVMARSEDHSHHEFNRAMLVVQTSLGSEPI